jgi:N-acetylglucosamine-6-phosphate deacetylase
VLLIAGADLVLPDRIVSPGTLAVDGDRIVEILSSGRPHLQGAAHFDFVHHYIVPGFVDVHVPGVEGVDTLDGNGAIAAMAARLPKFGVTAFCPTSIACAPDTLREMLAGVRRARTSRVEAGARVLPAHLESNFINPDYRGAQPVECLRVPGAPAREGEFTGAEILAEIAAARPDVGIVTVAPELDGALDLIRDLAANGHCVSLGHSGATYEQAVEGIRAGARHATHLFNRMSAASHRAPGLTGAVLESDEVTAELICDAVHVHPAMMRTALAAKRVDRVMAITDGTAGSGLPPGARTHLGGRPITVGDAARLDDGTLAGSVLTMNRAFARLVADVGLSLVQAATVCSTTPARALGLQGFGVLAPGATADFVVLDRELRVVQTWIGGALAWSADT